MRRGIVLIFLVFVVGANENIFSPSAKIISGNDLIELMVSLSPINVGSCTVANIRKTGIGISFDFEKDWKKQHYNLPIAVDAKVKVVHGQNKIQLYHYCKEGPESIMLELDHNQQVTSVYHYYEVSKFQRLIGKVFGSDLMLFNECKLEEDRVNQGSRSIGSPGEQTGDTTNNIQAN